MNSLQFGALQYSFIAVFICLSQAKSLTFFEHENGQGEFYSVEFEGLQCYNIPSYFNDKATSINTFDSCIISYEDSDCEGKRQVIAPGTQNHGNLGEIDFNDKISSFRQCVTEENVCRRVNVDLDYSEAPDLREVALKMKQTIEEWYPRTCRLLWSPALREVGTIKLFIDGKNEGVAGAGGNHITAHASHYRRHPNDMGSMVHEMAHIIQHYSKCAGWMTEGIADYPRRWFYENEKPEKPSGQFEGSSHTYLLKWIDERWPNTIYKLNHACREGTFDDGLLQRLTGKNEKQLWKEMQRGC